MKRENFEDPKPTSTFFTSANVKCCVFCKKDNHYSNQCKIITDVKLRCEFLKKNHLCFNCIKSGHSKKNCKNNIRCYHCTGNHNTALCYQRQNRNSCNNGVQRNPTQLPQIDNKGSKTNQQNQIRHEDRENQENVHESSVEEKLSCLVEGNMSIILQSVNAIATDTYENKFSTVKICIGFWNPANIYLRRVGDDDIFQEQIKLSIIEEVNSPGIFNNVTYLPHREVAKENRSTTKIRVVFDASVKVEDHPSLNDILYNGPRLLPKLYDLLLAFRAKPIVLIRDIETAFLQIVVHENHRDLLRCLWFKNLFNCEPTEIQAYRFTRLIFGASSSPFLLNATIRKHGQSYEKIDEEFARIARKKSYVDDLNCGVNDVEEGFD